MCAGSSDPDNPTVWKFIAPADFGLDSSALEYLSVQNIEINANSVLTRGFRIASMLLVPYCRCCCVVLCECDSERRRECVYMTFAFDGRHAQSAPQIPQVASQQACRLRLAFHHGVGGAAVLLY